MPPNRADGNSAGFAGAPRRDLRHEDNRSIPQPTPDSSCRLQGRSRVQQAREETGSSRRVTSESQVIGRHFFQGFEYGGPPKGKAWVILERQACCEPPTKFAAAQGNQIGS